MKKSLKTLLYALPLIALGACSSDEPLGGKDDFIAKDTETRYLKVNLVNAVSQTRAIGDNATTDYANGTEAENKIHTLDFIFYDADKEFHSHVNLHLDSPELPTPNPGPGSPSVEAFYTTDVPVSLVQGEKLPTYVLCIVNAVAPQRYDGRSMAEAQEQTVDNWYSTDAAGNQYMGMNNSVYYGRDEVTGEEDQLIMATPFDTQKLMTKTELDDLTGDALEAATTDIYVERYAAKVKFDGDWDNITPWVSGNGVSLTFEPLKWGLNSYEKSFYLIKSYRDETNNLVFSDKNDLDGFLFTGWNRPDHFRSFWARSPGYYHNDYPLVADDILDTFAAHQAGTDYKFGESIYYQSYNSLGNALSVKEQYAMESTMKETRLTGADDNLGDQYLPLTSIPSVILVGEYKINGKATTFYTYNSSNSNNGNPNIYSENDGEIDGVTTIHDRLLRAQTIVMYKNDKGSYSNVRAENLAGKRPFEVKHPDNEVRAGMKVGGDLVTLQLKDFSGYYFYDSNVGDYVAITAANLAQVNRLLYQTLGGAHMYYKGKAFFSVPIQHWGWQRSDNSNAKKDMADWKWEDMKVGDFGIVRNHIYNIHISGIKGIGTGILDEEQPLLPPTDKVGYSVNFRINIQKWATLPTQTWEW